MVVAKITRVANGKHRSAPRPIKKAVKRTPSVRSSNPAHFLTLAFPNHKRRASVVKAKKRKSNAGHKSLKIYRPHKMKKSNHRPRKHNPQFFGSHASPVRVAEYVAAGLVGVAINRAIVAALPTSITSNNIFATLAAAAIAVAQWVGGSMVSKDLGSAFGFGGMMNAASQALQAFIPSVGSVVSLNGVGRVGDFVPGMFTIPPQPAGIGAVSGYPSAYPM